VKSDHRLRTNDSQPSHLHKPSYSVFKWMLHKWLNTLRPLSKHLQQTMKKDLFKLDG